MAKFKVGDKVRCVSYGDGSAKFIGEVGTVVLVQDEGHSYPYRVSFPSQPEARFGGPLCLEGELELVEEEEELAANGYVFYTEWDDRYHARKYLKDVPEDAVQVFELGDELVKRVTWEKKDA